MRFTPPTPSEVPTAAELVAAMDDKVAGLEKVKARLAITLHRFMLSAALGREWRPANMLVIGPSGGGKTFLLTQLLDACRVVWCDANATEFSDVGYSGRDLASMYVGLAGPRYRGVRDSEGGKPVPIREFVPVAEQWGVVLLDEFDKLRTEKTPRPGERQVGRALQNELLKLVEGADVQVKRNDDDQGFFLNTSNILHIAVGAFEGLNAHIAKSRESQFVDEDLFQHVELQHLIDYGFSIELIGRFSTVLSLPPLESSALVRILNEQIIPKWRHQAEDLGIDLQIDGGAINTAADIGVKQKVGARALEPLLDECLWWSFYNAHRGDRVSLDSAGVVAHSSTLHCSHQQAAA